jgi:ABC-type thiamin/hydroxymethylpyrimidine transport system permease subunit
MDWKLGYKGSYYILTKGIFQLTLASTGHFSMINLKANHPEKYNPTLHKILVGIWGLVGILGIIDFITNYI